jgi:malate dehydrogenase (oxaloacetate-decarboxylating)
MVQSMAERPIIFALANPIPEIMPETARNAGAFIIATGRSDYPNQVNNSLVFPGLFKATLETGEQFTNDIFVRVAVALAEMVVVPNTDSILPTMFEERVVETVYSAVKNKKA